MGMKEEKIEKVEPKLGVAPTPMTYAQAVQHAVESEVIENGQTAMYTLVEPMKTGSYMIHHLGINGELKPFFSRTSDLNSSDQPQLDLVMERKWMKNLAKARFIPFVAPPMTKARQLDRCLAQFGCNTSYVKQLITEFLVMKPEVIEALALQAASEKEKAAKAA